MTRLRPAAFAAILGLLVGCGPNGQGQPGGNASLDQVAQSIGRGLKKVKQSLDEAELTGKVFSRLAWDKKTRPLNLTLDAAEGGVMTVSGKVPNRELHARVLDLVAETVGVREVIDKVEIDPNSAPAPSGGGRPERLGDRLSDRGDDRAPDRAADRRFNDRDRNDSGYRDIR